MALAMLALMVIPSLTVTVGADGDGDMACAIERAQIYLDKVRKIADNMAVEYQGNVMMQGYLNQLYALLGRYDNEGPKISFQTEEYGIAGWSSDEYHSEGRSARLYVVNGGFDWAEVSIPVDIAMKDIGTLKFWEKIELGSGTNVPYDVNIVLGIDLDGDGFEADVAGWHVTDSHNPDLLGDDTFIEMDGALGPLSADVTWTEIDALANPRWWTPNVGGDGLSVDLCTTFTDLLTKIDAGNFDTNVPNTDVRVKLVSLVIGGSGSWMDETAYVDDIEINGTPYDFEEEEQEGLGAEGFLDQASASLGEGDIRSAARSLASARNIIGRINGLLKSMAKAHKVTRTERFNQKFQRRIEGIEDKIERPKGPKK